MKRGRKASCITLFTQDNSIKDSESSINRDSKYKMTTAYSIDTKKKVFQTSHSVAEVILVLALCILNGGYLSESTQVDQIPAFYGGEDGSAKVRGSPSLYTGHGGIGGA